MNGEIQRVRDEIVVAGQIGKYPGGRKHHVVVEAFRARFEAPTSVAMTTRLSRRFSNLRLHVVGADSPRVEGLQVESKDWSLEEEGEEEKGNSKQKAHV